MKTAQITNKPLTRKQQAFVTELVNNPKDSATQVALRVYNASSPNSAKSIATENLSKPAIITELAKYNNLVENTLINTINDYSNSDKLGQRTLAVETSKYIHDKIHGKATQRIEQRSEKLIISIDLTGEPTN
jgi:phage terminase small subunit